MWAYLFEEVEADATRCKPRDSGQPQSYVCGAWIYALRAAVNARVMRQDYAAPKLIKVYGGCPFQDGYDEDHVLPEYQLLPNAAFLKPETPITPPQRELSFKFFVLVSPLNPRFQQRQVPMVVEAGVDWFCLCVLNLHLSQPSVLQCHR